METSILKNDALNLPRHCQITEPQRGLNTARTFVRGSGREPACGGDVVIFVLRKVVLDFFHQGEACGERSGRGGGGGLGQEAARHPEAGGGSI